MLTDVALIRRYDQQREARNKALDELAKTHAELMRRTQEEGGTLQTDAGYAAIGFQTRKQDDPAVKERLRASGELPFEIVRVPILNVVAYQRKGRALKPHQAIGDRAGERHRQSKRG